MNLIGCEMSLQETRMCKLTDEQIAGGFPLLFLLHSQS